MTPKIMKRITTAAMLLLGAVIAAEVSGAIVPPEKVAPNSTYCNPLNLDYCFRPDRGTGREAADPLIVPFKGDYYLFPSKSAGYWWSPDLIHWNLVPSNESYGYIGDGEHVPNGFPEKDLPVWGYNPAASVINGALVYSQQCDAFYRFIDPKQGTFERVGDRVPVANDEWIFTDDDGKTWRLLVDQSANRRDVPHDYVQLETPVTARHVKLTNIHMAGHGKFALRDLRVFGSGLGKPPAEAMPPVVKRGKDLEAVQAEIEWPAADGATGYVVRWGHAKDQLYHSQDVRDGSKTVVAGLTGGLDYFFVIDSFNDSGVTFGRKVVPCSGGLPLAISASLRL